MTPRSTANEANGTLIRSPADDAELHRQLRCRSGRMRERLEEEVSCHGRFVFTLSSERRVIY